MAQVLVKVRSNDSGKNNNIAAINGWFLTNDNELFPFIVKFEFYLGTYAYLDSYLVDRQMYCIEFKLA